MVKEDSVTFDVLETGPGSGPNKISINSPSKLPITVKSEAQKGENARNFCFLTKNSESSD